MSWKKRPKEDLAGQPEALYPAALAYLARRDHGVAELAAKLTQRGGDPADVAQLMAELQAVGYLDDARFAAGRARERRLFSHRGRFAVRQELRELGVEENIIEDAMAAEYSPEQELALLIRLSAAELRRIPPGAEPEQIFKRRLSIQRRLLSRGFPGSTVRQALSAAAANDESQEWQPFDEEETPEIFE